MVSVVFWILIGAPSKDLVGNVVIKENSRCFETAHDFWEIKGIPSRIPHGQTNLGHCCDANSAQHMPVSLSTSHGNACTGTTDKNHTESRTQLLQTLPFHPGSIWNPPQDTYSHTGLLRMFFKDLERQGCCVITEIFLQNSLTNPIKRFQWTKY